MKMLKKNDCLNEFLKGKTAAKNFYFEFIFMILTVILTVIRNLRLIKQSFHRDCTELSGVYENKHSFTNQKELKKQNQFVYDKKSFLSDEVLTAKQFNEFDCVNEECCCQKCGKVERDYDVARSSRFA